MSSAVFQAIEAHDAVTLAALLAAGSDPDEVDTEMPYVRLLHAAIIQIEYGASMEMIEILLRAGAGIDLTYPGLGGGTPLLVAMFNEHWGAAKRLVEAGADPNVRGEEGDSPLRYCAETGNADFARYLLAHGADRTIDGSGGFCGRTALGWAAYRLDLDMAATLIAAGARVDARNLDGETARDFMPDRDPERTDLWLKVAALLAVPPSGP